MKFVGLGANLPHALYGSPAATLAAVLEALDSHEIRVIRQSRFYRTAPVPLSDQPWFVNAVAAIETDWPPDRLLGRLHAVEMQFGRIRRERLEPRVVDLDLLAYDDQVAPGEPHLGAPILPHPRMHRRAFVLLPLAELAPDWRHPRLALGIGDLIARLDRDQIVEVLVDDNSRAS